MHLLGDQFFFITNLDRSINRCQIREKIPNVGWREQWKIISHATKSWIDGASTGGRTFLLTANDRFVQSAEPPSSFATAATDIQRQVSHVEQVKWQQLVMSAIGWMFNDTYFSHKVSTAAYGIMLSFRHIKEGPGRGTRAAVAKTHQLCKDCGSVRPAHAHTKTADCLRLQLASVHKWAVCLLCGDVELLSDNLKLIEPLSDWLWCHCCRQGEIWLSQ